MEPRENLVDRLAPRLLTLWAGLALGVGFLATPAKFLAPSLSLPVALDVGRRTFRVYNRVELVLAAVLILSGLWAGARRRLAVMLSVPVLVVVTETLWLLPALDVRTAAVVAGAAPPGSDLHGLYIAAEAVKALWLLVFGLAGAVAPVRAAGFRSPIGGFGP
jgi:hypothetical protein